MFKQIFNRPNQIIFLSSNIKFKKQILKNNFFFTNSSIRSNSYLTKNNINKIIINYNQNFFLFSKLQLNNNVLSSRRRQENVCFQSTTIINVNNQEQSLETNSLEMIIDQNKETLLKGQKINNDNNVLDSNHKIFEKSKFIANESSNLLNEKEISGETSLIEKDEDAMEKNTLDNNQQVLEKSISFSNEETSLNYNKEINDVIPRLTIQTEKEISDEISLMEKDVKEKNTLDDNQQVLEKSISFSNEETSLNYNREINDAIPRLTIQTEKTEKEISGEISLMEKDVKEKNTLDDNQQVLEKSISFSNEETSLNYNKEINDVIPSLAIQTEKEISGEISLTENDVKETLDDNQQVLEKSISFSNKETSLNYAKTIIQTEGRNINDIWNDYKNLSKEQFKMLKVKDFNLIIEAFRKSLKNPDISDKSSVHSKILSVFEDLEMKAKLTPDVTTYNMFMSTALNLRDLSNLCNLFKTMKSKGIQPNTVSYNIMMSGFAKNSFRNEVFTLHREMIKSGITGNEVTYTILLSTCAKDKRMEIAMKYYKLMKEDGIKPDFRIYNALLNVLVYEADRDHIIGTYEEMIERGIEPTVLTYSSLIKAMALRKEKEYAEKFYNEMESRGIKPNVLILDSMGITGFDAIQKLKSSGGMNLNLLDYNSLLCGCLKGSKYDDAFKIFNIMRENEINPSLATFTIIIGAYLRNDEIEKAKELFSKMKDDNIAPDSQIYTFMIDFLLNQKSLNKTFNLLLSEVEKDNIIFKKEGIVRLFDSASKLEDSKVIEKLFNVISGTGSKMSSLAIEKILLRLSNNEDYEEKIDYYLNFMKNNDIYIQSTTYGAIIEGFIQRNDSKNAVEWYKLMIDDEFIPTGKVIFKMVQFFAKKNQVDATLRYWNDFYNFGVKPGKEDFNFIIDFCCKAENHHIISEVFYQCRKMGFVPISGNLLKIMNFYHKNGRIMKVIEYWDLFYALGIKPRLDVIDFMVNFCCTLGNKGLISQILSQCEDAGYDAFSLYRLRKSNKVATDDVNSLLLEMSDMDNNTDNTDTATNTSYEKNLEVIEHWISSREKGYNTLLNINKKINLSEINRLRRVLNIEERALREREKLAKFLSKYKTRLDISAQKSLQSWTPYKKSKQTTTDTTDTTDTSNTLDTLNSKDNNIVTELNIIPDLNDSYLDSIIESAIEEIKE